LLLADEPTGNLDSVTGVAIFDLLIDLHTRTGATLIVATHDPAVDASCNHHLAIRDGRMETPSMPLSLLVRGRRECLASTCLHDELRRCPNDAGLPLQLRRRRGAVTVRRAHGVAFPAGN
jgi:ABC-type glutathione transport system ATPase component